VMAGCKPEYFPAVVAAVRAAIDPGFCLYTINTTTNPVAPMVIVNGPARNELEINCSYAEMGPGARANATIGRAVNLVMSNIGGRIRGVVSKSTHSQPAWYSFCFGEYEEESPWAPFHVERGFAPEQSCVSVAAATGTSNIYDGYSQKAEGLLRTLAGSMKTIGATNLFPYFGLGPLVVVLCPDHARLLHRDGLTKDAVKQELLERTQDIPISWWSDEIQAAYEVTSLFTGKYSAVASRAEQFEIIVAGGHGGYHSVFVPTLGESLTITQPIGKEVRR
jgi:hypothetical protein